LYFSFLFLTIAQPIANRCGASHQRNTIAISQILYIHTQQSMLLLLRMFHSYCVYKYINDSFWHKSHPGWHERGELGWIIKKPNPNSNHRKVHLNFQKRRLCTWLIRHATSCQKNVDLNREFIYL
jgi:hypothetical protein